MSDTDASFQVILNSDQSRYELWSGSQLAGFASFRLRPGKLEIFHVEVQSEFEGHGIGSQLAAGALDSARAQGLGVVPACPFVAHYLRQHPEHADLLVD